MRGLIAAAILVMAAWAAAGQDAYNVVSQKQQTIYEADWVRVRRVVYAPAERVPMHEHKQRVVVFLSDGTVRSIAADGKATDTEFHRGQVNWSEPIRHALENAGKTPLEAVEVELLGPHPAVAQEFNGDPLKQDPKHFKLEFENDRVRVFRFSIGPHETSSVHDHLDHVTVELSDAHVRAMTPDGKTQEASEKAGNASFRPAARHTVENVGETGFETISIEFKSSK